MTFQPPEQFNIAGHFLDARIEEGKGDRTALLTDEGNLTYREVQTLANRFGSALRGAGVEAEQRVIIALPDGPEFVAALFGTLKIGAVVVMVNPHLKVDAIEYFFAYTRATVAVIHRESQDAFREAARA
ncbi:MAG: AMP-binding protein, partial [Gemmatimonadetes bacterium]|nr:AMP-binding protein [Gemmatimonadota bacterium]